jgi:hypothetical protein
MNHYSKGGFLMYNLDKDILLELDYNDTIDYLNDFDNEGDSYMQDVIFIDDIEEDNVCLYY